MQLVRTMVSISALLCTVACGDDSGGAAGNEGGGSGGTGGNADAGGTGGGDAGDTMAAADAGPVEKCPAPATCVAPVGEYICGEGGIPPSCKVQSECDYGTCMQFAFGGFCILPCVGDIPATVSVTGTIVEFEKGKGFANAASPGVEGVEVCVHENSDVPCVMTDAKGKFALDGVPTEVAYLLTFHKDGYGKVVRQQPPAVADVTIYEPDSRLAKVDIAEADLAAAGVTPDDTKGSIGFGAAVNNDAGTESPFAFKVAGLLDLIFLEGYTVSIDPKAGTGPVYRDADEEPDPSLTKSSEAGYGFFVDLPPGDYSLTFEHPDLKGCTPVDVTVIADHATLNVGPECQM